MTVKYDVLYINGNVESFTKGALSIEQVQKEALHIAKDVKVLDVVYTIQNNIINIDELENLSEVFYAWTGDFLHYVPEWSVYSYKYRAVHDTMMAILSDAEVFYGYAYAGDREDIVSLHEFLRDFIECSKQNILWIYDYLRVLPKLPSNVDMIPLEELFDIYYEKADFLALKVCEEQGLKFKDYLHQNVQTLKEHIQE